MQRTYSHGKRPVETRGLGFVCCERYDPIARSSARAQLTACGDFGQLPTDRSADANPTMAKCERSIPLIDDQRLQLKQLYGRLLLRRRPGLSLGAILPNLNIRAALPVDPEVLERYRALCHITTGGDLPLLFPQVLLGRLHLQLVAHPEFPLSAWGLLHVRNAVFRHRAVSPTTPLEAYCALTRQRVVEKGLEFDLDNELRCDGQIVWQSVSTILKRGRFGVASTTASRDATRPSGDAAVPSAESFQVPADIGRKFARLTGDFNPIHVSNLAAKLFGFPRAIAHGMWAVARGLSQTIDETSGPLASPCRLDAQFKGPVFVGSRVTVRRDAERFEFYCGDNPRPVVTGAYWSQADLTAWPVDA